MKPLPIRPVSGRPGRRAVTFGLALLLLACAGRPALAAGPADGVWLTEDEDVIVEVGPCGAASCGRIVWLKAGPDVRNAKDPDPARRGLPLCGVTVLTDVRPDGNGWKAAALYDPEDGETYRNVGVAPAGDRLTLTVRVFLFSQSTTWTRTASPDRCTPAGSRP